MMLLCVARAQTTGSISGYVTDTIGAAVPGATVTILEVNTNSSRVLQTDAAGRFSANLMPVGNYSVSVAAPSFQKTVKNGVLLEAAAAPELSFTLAPASTSSTVTVEAAPVVVQTTDSSLGQVIHSQQVADLPLNGRDFVELATLTPGTAQGDQPNSFFSGTGSEVDIRGSYSLSVGGSRENRTDWLYDGVDNNELTAGGLAIQPSIDALDEFNVLTYNYSVQYGSRAGPTVLLTSKSGTNAFHGTLFEFFRNTVLNSFGYFAPERPEFNQNQFGGSVGGPIIKDKLFFFFDYQGTRLDRGIPSAAQVPTALERQGIFTESFSGAPVEPIYDPQTTHIDPNTGMETRDVFSGNTIPAGRMNTIAQKMLTYFPLPNVPGTLAANYVSVPVFSLTDNEFDLRLDYTLSKSDSAFARFSRDQASNFSPDGLPDFGSQPFGFDSNQTLADRGRNLAVSETHIFSGNAVNQFTMGYNRIFDHITSFGDGTNWNDQLGIPNANLGTFLSSGLLNTQLGSGYWGLGDRGFSPIQDGTNIYQYSDDFEWTHGAHSLSMGIATRFMQLNEMGDTFPMGELSFDNLFTAGFTNGSFNSATGNPIASFLLGIPAAGEHDDAFSGTVSGRRWKEFRPYAQDNWKLRPNFTLQVGLAYNYTTPIVEAINRMSNFDFDTGKLLIAGINSNSSAGVQPYKLDFEPRIGIAFSPFSDKNAIRAGYAVLHDVGWNLGAQGLDLNPPFYGTYAFQTDDITPVTTLTQGFPAPMPVDLNNLSGNLYSENTNFRPGLIEQFNLNVQRELPSSTILTVGYAGARDSHLQTGSWNLNTAPPNLQIDPPSLRPYPNLNTIIAFLDRGLSRYDSLQAKVEKRNQHGLYFLVSYTYSKSFDNGLNDNLGSLIGVPYFPLNPYPHADKGLSPIDQTNNIAASVLYQLPFGRGSRFASGTNRLTEQLIGKWQLNVISHLGSGFPLGLVTGINTSGTNLVSAGSSIGNRPDQICNGKLKHHTVNEFFNTSCFVDPAPGMLGDASRTPLFGPDFVNFDGSLFKTFELPWEKQLSFRTEVFNVFNHPQFAFPGISTDTPSFGQITATVNNPRLIQFALKLIF